MNKRTIIALVLVLLLAAVVTTACGGSKQAEPTQAPAPTQAPEATTAPEPTPVPEPTTAPEPELVGDSLEGGRLYDKWWEELGVDVPEGDQPLWASQSSNKRSGGDTWRCKECHGWDYKGVEGAYGSGSHKTGFPGVMAAAQKGAAYVLGALKGETNPDHDFSSVMNEQALVDLTLFLTQDLVDESQFITADKQAAQGDVAIGKDLFLESCSDCHGPEGLAMNFKNETEPEYVGSLANDNPWEFFHKMRVGQPGEEDMPPAIDLGWTEEEQASVLAFVQTLPLASPISEGGVLYDKWWKAMGIDAPEGDQPLWVLQSSNNRSGSDTWRCKECHGWDYKGVDGVYGSGSHKTGFPGIVAAASKSPEDIAAWFDGTANPDHDFSPYLGEAQIAMLVAFIQNGLHDVSPYVNDDKSANGDSAQGKIIYTKDCKRCHGEDGKAINFGSDSDPEYVGTVASDNPWEFFHKASYGQPGEHMPSGINLDLSLEDLADLLSYVQALPAK
ncbi:MAG: cytochrome c [Chloroflexi bacterium]|nr:cytochrome c [Chloroflexota bacterium]